MQIMNLMPVDITYAPNGDMSKAIVIPKSGKVAKLSVGEQEITLMETEIGEVVVFSQPKWGELYVCGIGEEMDDAMHMAFPKFNAFGGVLYLVNAVVAQELAGRVDVITPASGNDGVIREDGKIIAVTHFNQFT